MAVKLFAIRSRNKAPDLGEHSAAAARLDLRRFPEWFTRTATGTNADSESSDIS
jgi:hypothetical protein